MILDCAGEPLDLSYPRVMGVLNVTPDSFYDGGEFLSIDAALAHVRIMVEEGASIIDIGGESTRPGAIVVPVSEEIHRIVPIIQSIKAEIGVLVSIDTSKPEVMYAAVQAGAGLINDVQALCVDGALQAAGELGVPVCLMHAQGTPQNMQDKPEYKDVVREVCQFLMERVSVCERAGISRDRLILDPGFGFGKEVHHNLRLMKNLHMLINQELPVLVGISRKSIIGALLNVTIKDRLVGGLSLAIIAVLQGTKIIRSHDVRETIQAISICNHVMQVKDFD